MSVAAFIFASTWFGLDSPAGVIAAASGTVYSMGMLVWLLQYRGVFSRTFGPVAYTSDTVVPVEDERLPDFELERDSIRAAE